MNNSKHFRDLIEIRPDYMKKVILLVLIKNDKGMLLEIGLSERYINRLNLEFKNILIQHHEEVKDYVKNEEESVIEKFLNK